MTALLAAFLVVAPLSAATPSNFKSPLGMNLDGVSYYSTEQPFINIFLTNGGWTTHGPTRWDTNEEPRLQLDANGYPTTLTAKPADPNSPQLFDSVGVLLERQGGPYFYPAGRYVVLYDGEGKLAYGFDARLMSASPGRDVIEVVKPTDMGIDLRITATDPRHNGNYIRNIRVTRAENEAALRSGHVFDPLFLGLLKNFRVLRFMDWLQTNGSTLSSWPDRPLPSNASWATHDGVPIEVAIDLANAVTADAWLNVPAAADDTYIMRMADLVHSRLGAAQKVYVEYSNEVWNSSFQQYAYAGSRGRAVWPNLPAGGGNYEWNRNWYGMRTAQMCDLWKQAWGSERDRVICVLGAQAASSYSATAALDCAYWSSGAPCWRHGIGAVAIAPYFGDANLPAQWTAQADGGLALLFKSLGAANAPGGSGVLGAFSDLNRRVRTRLARYHLIKAEPDAESGVPVGGWFHQIGGWETSYAAMLAPYHLPLVAYEGGQGFVGDSSTVATQLFIAANRDPRMRNAYTTYLQQWKANGGQLFVLFNDIGSYSKYGEWGALESLTQPSDSAANVPAKWRAIQDFITDTPCWWPGCSEFSAASHNLQAR